MQGTGGIVIKVNSLPERFFNLAVEFSSSLNSFNLSIETIISIGKTLCALNRRREFVEKVVMNYLHPSIMYDSQLLRLRYL